MRMKDEHIVRRMQDARCGYTMERRRERTHLRSKDAWTKAGLKEDNIRNRDRK